MRPLFFEVFDMGGQKVMRNFRFGLIRVMAVLVVIALAVFSPLLGPPIKPSERADTDLPTQPRYKTTFDRPRLEVRIERLLTLDDSNGDIPDIASLLKPEPQPQRLGPADHSAVSDEQVASISREGRGGDAQ
jgi:hypothetical protein